MLRPKVGVSACLLGEPVRYDGDHRRDAFVVEELGRVFEWVRVCPEVEAGFGVPRETLRLEGPKHFPRLRSTQTRIDHTERLESWCEARIAALPTDLCGFVFKAGSPSCGPARVALHPEDGGEPSPSGAGLFARAIRRRFPDLPCIDEQDLRDAGKAAAFARAVEERFRARVA
jgi:uncharacterized protein YbbK (DUF523 family)